VILDEGVSPWLIGLLIINQFDVADVTVLLELAAQSSLIRVETETSDEDGAAGVTPDRTVRLGPVGSLDLLPLIREVLDYFFFLNSLLDFALGLWLLGSSFSHGLLGFLVFEAAEDISNSVVEALVSLDCVVLSRTRGEVLQHRPSSELLTENRWHLLLQISRVEARQG